MSIYNRALSNAPQVDRRIVRAVDRVIRSLPTPGGVFGRVDVWSALQANAKEAGVPMDLDWTQVGKALDALCLACILTCRGGAYSEVAGVPPLKVEAPAVPADPPPVAEVEPAESDGLSPALVEVVTLLRERPMSSADLRAALEVTPSTITTRLSRLMLMGVVQKGAQIPSLHGGVPRYMYELAPPGTREVPSPAPAPEVAPPAPVKAEPWTARPKQGPDDGGRWYWEARATLETRVSRGLGWLAEDEVLPALQALGQTETPPDHVDRYIAELQAENRRMADLCNEAHSELNEAGAPDGTLAEQVRWLREALNVAEEVGRLRAERLQALPDAWVHADHMLDSVHVPEGPILDRLRAVIAGWERSRMPALRGGSWAVDPPSAGPAWPSLRNLDVDRDEAAITAIERRCAAWRTLLAAAREVAT